MTKQHYYLSRWAQCGAVLILIAPGLLWAETSMQATKIRFVNVPQIMQESPQAKAAKDRLQNEFSEQKKELDECNEDLDILDGKLRRQGRDMEEHTRERMLDTIRQKQRECGEISNKMREEYNQRRNEELEDLNKLIYGIIEKIAQDQDIGLIVGPPIIYTSEQVDLTATVLEELSKTK